MKKYSIIKFGSQLSTNFDKYSDKDLLVIAETIEESKRLHRKYTNEGWSVSSYTYSKLRYLSENGSLFLSHLKRDSEIIYDYEGKFKQIIDYYIEKDNYFDNIEEAKMYFKVIECIPDLKLGYAWFSDCFYVGLRNYLIFEYANKKQYEYSYITLIGRVLLEKRINESEYDTLKQLRVVKHNYRNNIQEEFPTKQYVASLIHIACQTLKMMNSPIFQKPMDIPRSDFRKKIMDCKNGYQRLRLIEGYYCAQEINLPVIKKIVSNPQFYASKLMNIKYVEKIISFIKMKNTSDCIDESLEEQLIQYMNE